VGLEQSLSVLHTCSRLGAGPGVPVGLSCWVQRQQESRRRTSLGTTALHRCAVAPTSPGLPAWVPRSSACLLAFPGLICLTDDLCYLPQPACTLPWWGSRGSLPGRPARPEASTLPESSPEQTGQHLCARAGCKGRGMGLGRGAHRSRARQGSRRGIREKPRHIAARETGRHRLAAAAAPDSPRPQALRASVARSRAEAWAGWRHKALTCGAPERQQGH